MEAFQIIISKINGLMWGWPMLILLFGTHIYLTIRLKVPQRKVFKGIALSVKRDPDSPGDVSQFGSLATVLAATIGTGNIVGVATAISLGGPGAVFWCWVTGVFALATKYSEGLLAVKYRVKTAAGTMLGGPMYALERGLGMKWLAVLFCIFTAIASLGIGCSVQANAIATHLNQTFNISPHWVGIILVALVSLVIFFGVKGIARVCEVLVPMMAAFYILGCLTIIIINASHVIPALDVIVRSAFSAKAAGGGLAGAGLMMAMRFGIARGLFSNESGMGSAPIAAAAAQTRNSVRQALVSSTGTFWDTVVVCALTGIVLVSSVLKYPEIDYHQGAFLTSMAFGKIPVVGPVVLLVGIVTFAFSTILGWSYYAERTVEYLGGLKMVRLYRLVFLFAVYVGAIMHLSFVWDLADIMNALMTIPNLVSLLLLSGVLARETNHYLWGNHLDDYDCTI